MGFDIPPDVPINEPVTVQCVISASQRYELPMEGLLSVMLTEGGRPGLAKKNANGSFDLGVMQINTVWLKPNSPLFGYLSMDALKHDVCLNIHVAAWIMAWYKKTSGDWWTAIGRYHAPYNSELARGYVSRVNGKLPVARRIVARSVVYSEQMRALMGGVAPSPSVKVAWAEPSTPAAFEPVFPSR